MALGLPDFVRAIGLPSISAAGFCRFLSLVHDLCYKRHRGH
jgi:hypothetical protein